LARLVFAADPAARAERARQASVGRRVEARANDDGLADLHGYDLPPHRTVAAMERVDAIAKAAKNAGDGRTMPQLRADILLDLLVGEGIAIGEAITGCPLAEDTPDTPPTSPARPAGTAASETPGAGAAFPDEERAADADDPIDWSGPHEPPEDWYDPARDDDDRSDQNYLPTTPTQPPTAAGAMPGPRRGVLDLQMSLTTLMGLTDHPGDLNGFGPVIADIARQVAAENPDMTWRYSIYDRMGTLIHHGLTRRRPTAIDAAFIRARDRTCRAPGCRAPAHRCDLDHSEAWSESGNTSRPNLSALCRTHHTWKHLPGTELVQLDDGVIAWKTPLGQCVTTHPAAYLHDY
jgi:hypothetical protein